MGVKVMSNTNLANATITGKFHLINVDLNIHIGPYNASFDLFEYDYCADLKFWYGVATAECTESDMNNELLNSGHTSHIIDVLWMHILLDDGRVGVACIARRKSMQSSGKSYMEFAFSGRDPLVYRPVTP
jgi:hypothetical protein